MPNAKVIKMFCILDLDRTLVCSDTIRALYETILVDLVPGIGPEVTEARARFKSNFDLFSYLWATFLQRMSEPEAEQLLAKVNAEFLKHARESTLFEPHAEELLTLLEKHKIPYGILTAGGDVWQKLKIQAVGLQNTPHLIVRGYEKGKLIASWRQPAGGYRLPQELGGVRTQALMFLDDKTISFSGIPADVIAVRVVSVTAQEPLEKDTVLPPHVRQVMGIKEAIELLFLK